MRIVNTQYLYNEPCIFVRETEQMYVVRVGKGKERRFWKDSMLQIGHWEIAKENEPDRLILGEEHKFIPEMVGDRIQTLNDYKTFDGLKKESSKIFNDNLELRMQRFWMGSEINRLLRENTKLKLELSNK